MRQIANFIRDEQAATTAEYGIIVVVMAAIAVAALRSIDGSIGDLFTGARTNIANGTSFSSNIR